MNQRKRAVEGRKRHLASFMRLPISTQEAAYRQAELQKARRRNERKEQEKNADRLAVNQSM